MEIKARYPYWKIPVVILFIGLIYLGVNLNSEHWIPFLKGILYFSDLTDDQQITLIHKICFYTAPVLSVLFLAIRYQISNIALITLMIIFTLMVFPFGYVKDPTIGF